MTRRVRALVVAIAVGIAGCQPQPSETIQATDVPPTAAPTPSPAPTVEPSPTPLPSGAIGVFSTTIAQADGSLPIDVTVEDRTGLVVGIEGSLPDNFDERLVDAPVPQQGLQYTWVMRGCSRQAVITFETADVGTPTETYRLSSVHEDQLGDCLAVEVGRTILLELSRPVPAATVIALPPAMATYRLMFDHFVDRFPTEFELLDTTGLVTGLAHPTKLGEHSGLRDAVAPDSGLLYWPGPSMFVYRIAMVFEAADAETYRLRVWFDLRYVGVSSLDSMGRWVLIQLREPIRARNVDEVVEHLL